MTKVFLIMILVLFAAVLFLFFLWMIEANKSKQLLEELKAERERLDDAISAAIKLENTIDILKQNRKEADEKISDLHNGDSLSNALNELRKRQD